ncbi:bacteriorhodopsin [Subtercola sp. RTI3]|uniref:bacteriorhodopsin n=1 Tax=Subtercola sp. RTI3 TaxID=3048639 RepID=UPI002B234B56|nr:bacteriorhodopsin [Subtercola sp. RTI3]MEA9986406.1 bacteriorhodopsin [Subtercola sp. RTI3]
MITAVAPWSATLTSSEYLLTLYFLAVAALALFAGFVRAWLTRGEVGSRYRPAVVARICITAIATVSYIALVVSFVTGYDKTPAGYVPNDGAIFGFAARYMDWSLNVPLLSVELLAVCAAVGAVARQARLVAAASAFLMIFTGFLGAFIIGGGTDTAQLIVWGAVSCVFWFVTIVVLVRGVLASREGLTPDANRLLRRAATLLLSGWVVYPVVYLIQIFGDGGGWAATMQIALCVADVTIKIGFGTLIHRVAKLRTAEDVRAGDDVHPESIWISSVKQSDAGVPREVYLAAGASIHERRVRPPTGSAVASPLPDEREN